MNQGSPLTPRRIYLSANICVICGFALFHTEITSTGQRIERKSLNIKLKLTDERIQNISNVIESFERELCGKNGICTKCYRNVEKVLHMQNDLIKLRKDLKGTRSSVRHSYHLTCTEKIHRKKDF